MRSSVCVPFRSWHCQNYKVERLKLVEVKSFKSFEVITSQVGRRCKKSNVWSRSMIIGKRLKSKVKRPKSVEDKRSCQNTWGNYARSETEGERRKSQKVEIERHGQFCSMISENMIKFYSTPFDKKWWNNAFWQGFQYSNNWIISGIYWQTYIHSCQWRGQRTREMWTNLDKWRTWTNGQTMDTSRTRGIVIKGGHL